MVIGTNLTTELAVERFAGIVIGAIFAVLASYVASPTKATRNLEDKADDVQERLGQLLERIAVELRTDPGPEAVRAWFDANASDSRRSAPRPKRAPRGRPRPSGVAKRPSVRWTGRNGRSKLSGNSCGRRSGTSGKRSASGRGGTQIRSKRGRRQRPRGRGPSSTSQRPRGEMPPEIMKTTERDTWRQSWRG